MTGSCPIPGCRKLISRKHFACLAHWDLIATALQIEVNAAAVALAEARANAPHTTPTNELTAYRDAAQRAIASVAREKETTS